MNIKEQIKETGYVTEEIDPTLDIRSEIRKLVNKKNAVILAHYYVNSEIQDIADFVGDSLALSQKAAKTKADIIVFAGVHFMAETAKILSPSKKVILPDLTAGCSMADSCPPDDFKKFLENYPDHTVVSYVNATADVKCLSDIVCTSSNAVQIIESIPKHEKIVFAPDRNLGNYISRQSGREMVIWDGACHVHVEFSLKRILAIKNEQPDAQIIAHPECEAPVLKIADFIGSTSQLINYVVTDKSKKYIVATEPGVLHEMKKLAPGKELIPAPGEDSECACSECEFMKKHSLSKLYNSLKYEMPEIQLENSVIEAARKPIVRMLEISEKIKA